MGLTLNFQYINVILVKEASGYDRGNENLAPILLLLSTNSDTFQGVQPINLYDDH